MAVIDLFLYFILYSFLGWCCETVYCSVIQRRWVNRGFLNGPLCPVYGFGALLVLFLLRDVRHSFTALFLSGMVVTSVLEYLTSYILEKLFHMHWWDYSHMRFNLNGRVCLLNSCEFGLLSVFVVMFLHPAVTGLVGKVPAAVRAAAAALLLAAVLSDTFVTVRGLLIMKGKLDELAGRMAELKLRTEEGRDKLRLALTERADAFRENMDSRADAWREWAAVRMEIFEADYEQDRRTFSRRMEENAEEYRRSLEERRRRLDALREKLAQLDKRSISRSIYRRLMRAFPNLKAEQNRRLLDAIRDRLDSFSR